MVTINHCCCAINLLTSTRSPVPTWELGKWKYLTNYLYLGPVSSNAMMEPEANEKTGTRDLRSSWRRTDPVMKDVFFWLSWLWYICLQFGLGSPWAAGSNPAFFPISWSMKRILTLTSGSCGSLGLGGDGRLPCCVLASWIKGKWVNQKNKNQHMAWNSTQWELGTEIEWLEFELTIRITIR